jgi:glycosyltransferase involved in cell wall biosynthesis
MPEMPHVLPAAGAGRSLPRVCFVQPRVYPCFDSAAGNARGGGAERQIHHLSVGLAAHGGFEVSALVADFGQPLETTLQGVRLRRAFSFDSPKPKALLDLLRAMRDLDADVYVFRSADLGVAAAITLVKRVLGKKCLYMLAHCDERNLASLRRMSGAAAAVAMGLAYRLADAVTAQFAEQARMFERCRGIVPAAVIPNIYPASPQAPGEGARRGALWVGRCERWKNPELFCELAARHPGETFTMVCPMAEGKKAYWREIGAVAAGIPNLAFRDYAPPEELAVLYRESALLVITSLAEGFPNTMLEAMDAGCPVLSHRVDPDGALERGGFGLCAKGDDAAFFEMFAGLAGDASRRAAMGERGRETLRARHAPGPVADRFEQVLRTLL